MKRRPMISSAVPAQYRTRRCAGEIVRAADVVDAAAAQVEGQPRAEVLAAKVLRDRAQPLAAPHKVVDLAATVAAPRLNYRVVPSIRRSRRIVNVTWSTNHPLRPPISAIAPAGARASGSPPAAPRRAACSLKRARSGASSASRASRPEAHPHEAAAALLPLELFAAGCGTATPPRHPPPRVRAARSVGSADTAGRGRTPTPRRGSEPDADSKGRRSEQRVRPGGGNPRSSSDGGGRRRCIAARCPDTHARRARSAVHGHLDGAPPDRPFTGPTR